MWDEKKLNLLFDRLRNAPALAVAPVVSYMSVVGDGAFRVLISTILSLRTKDETTGPATDRLFDLADSPETMILLNSDQIEKAIYPVGFYKTKTKQILKICHILIDQYKGQVPDDLDLLLELPGVGRKTANLVIAVAYEKPAICVDIHVHRISNRLGFCKTKSPEDTEFYIRENVPIDLWTHFNRLYVALGQTICRPISPKCNLCPIFDLCEKIIIKNNSNK